MFEVMEGFVTLPSGPQRAGNRDDLVQACGQDDDGVGERRKSNGESRTANAGAGNGIRTRDIKLGKLALYQLSYARVKPSLIQFTEAPAGRQALRCGIQSLY
jgi:hypothetical protein